MLAALGWVAPREPLRRGRSKVVLGLVLLVIVAGISLAEYVIWTPVGVAQVGGLQSRYYLPLLPFVVLLLPQASARSAGGEAGWKKTMLLGSAMALVCIVLAMPWVLANRVYGIGLGEAALAPVRR